MAGVAHSSSLETQLISTKHISHAEIRPRHPLLRCTTRLGVGRAPQREHLSFAMALGADTAMLPDFSAAT
jgi:hypothetical protein